MTEKKVRRKENTLTIKELMNIFSNVKDKNQPVFLTDDTKLFYWRIKKIIKKKGYYILLLNPYSMDSLTIKRQINRIPEKKFQLIDHVDAHEEVAYDVIDKFDKNQTRQIR